MIASFPTNFYRWLPFWFQKKIPKKTIEWKVLDNFDFLTKSKIDNKAMC